MKEKKLGAKRRKEVLEVFDKITKGKMNGIVCIVGLEENKKGHQIKTNGFIQVKHVTRSVQLRLLISAFDIEPIELLAAAAFSKNKK